MPDLHHGYCKLIIIYLFINIEQKKSESWPACVPVTHHELKWSRSYVITSLCYTICCV